MSKKKPVSANLILSPLSQLMPGTNGYIFPCFNSVGMMDKERFLQVVDQVKESGAKLTRDFFYINDKYASNLMSPFIINDGSILWNEQHFIELRFIVEAYCSRGITFIFSIFDHCSTKPAVGICSPWVVFSDFFYGKDAEPTVREYVRRVLNSLSGLHYMIDICNEPRAGKDSAAFQAAVFNELLKNGFNLDLIVLGVDYRLKEISIEYGNTYREFRSIVCSENKIKESDLKKRCWSTVHNSTLRNITDLLYDAGSNTDRKTIYSFDGVRNPRPTQDYVFNVVRYILEKRRKAAELGKIMIEVVFGKEYKDDYYAYEGVKRALDYVNGRASKNDSTVP